MVIHCAATCMVTGGAARDFQKIPPPEGGKQAASGVGNGRELKIPPQEAGKPYKTTHKVII